MKAHKEYREVDITGLYKIPKTWLDGKFKYNVYYQEGPGLRQWQFMNSGVKVICVTNITENGIDFSSYTKYISKEEYESSYKHFTVKRGNLLIASSGASWGKISEYDSDETVILNTSTIRLETSKRILNSFLKYLLESQYIQDQLSILITGSCQPNFGPTHLSKLDICLPSDVEEQRQIAAYLDYKTKQIDRFIANRKTQIELLEEQKEVIINKSVTKGIDSTVKLKPSGVDWIGDIPEHWEVRKVRFIGVCSNGISIGGDSFGSGFPFVSYGDVYKNETIPINPSGLVQSSLNDRIKYSIRKGDIFFTRTSETLDELGIASTASSDLKNAVFAGFLIRLRPRKNILFPEYSKYFFRSKLLREYFNNQNDLVTRASLNQETLKSLPVVIPPYEIQKSISTKLDVELSERNELISKYQKQIDLMQEYKSSLISKAITGKIDVREWQPKQTLKETV